MTALPCPRLEFRWTKADDSPDWTRRVCTYSLVIPLKPHDIRRELEDSQEREELPVRIGFTNCSGGVGDPPVYPTGEVHTPFRDGAHAQWDCLALGGHIPIVAVCEDVATIIPLTVKEPS